MPGARGLDRIAMSGVQFPGALLIQFAKSPRLGAVKTRMQPTLTPEQCLDLHCRLVRHVYRTLHEAELAPVELWATDEPGFEFFNTLLPEPSVRLQYGKDLGARMYNAIADGLNRAETIVLLGSDCPFFNRDILCQALSLLDAGEECVLGPASDGGYVLIGLRRLARNLFENIAWGTETVLAETRTRLRSSGFSWAETEVLHDIDTGHDLKYLTELKQYEDLVLIH